MIELPSLRRETRYGAPAADKLLYNRDYIIGYSYYFRQAKWALEIVDSEKNAERKDYFRPDYRVPLMFRVDDADYTHTGYARGHLVSSANRMETQLENSETFLMSNMSPQLGSFNSGIWKKLEDAVRKLNDKEDVLEVYVISGPIFYFNRKIETIEPDPDKLDERGREREEERVDLPIPHAFFKSVLAETKTGRLGLWTFLMENKKGENPNLNSYLVETDEVERLSGLLLWERLRGPEIDRAEAKKNKMWSLDKRTRGF